MILMKLCYLPGVLDPAILADLVTHDLGFTPERIRINRAPAESFSAEVVETLRGLEDVTSLKIETSDGLGGPRFSHGGMVSPAQVLILRTPSWPGDAFVEYVTCLPGLITALVGDADDVFWQSADRINTYQVFKRPWDHLPTISDQHGKDMIDTSANPGRRKRIAGIWLWAASKMWFGPASWGLIDRERLLELPVGQVSERDDGVIVVDLFDLGEDERDIRRSQQSFRDWMDYDDLEARANEIAMATQDPHFELDTGAFEHGGIRLLTEWFDGDTPVSRSKASVRRRRELDTAGKVIWEQTDLGASGTTSATRPTEVWVPFRNDRAANGWMNTPGIGAAVGPWTPMLT